MRHSVMRTGRIVLTVLAVLLAPILLVALIAILRTGVTMIRTADTMPPGYEAAWVAWGAGVLALPLLATLGVAALWRGLRRHGARVAHRQYLDTDLWRRLAHETGDPWSEHERMVIRGRTRDGIPTQILLTPGPRYPLHDPKAADRLARVFAAATLRQPGAVTAVQDGRTVWITTKTSAVRAPHVDQPERIPTAPGRA